MKIVLNNRALLKASGADSEVFLQNQLSNDINKLGEYEIQLNAYCHHQGKVIGLLWVMRYQDNFLISFPKSLKIIKLLSLFFSVISEAILSFFSLLFNFLFL